MKIYHNNGQNVTAFDCDGTVQVFMVTNSDYVDLETGIWSLTPNKGKKVYWPQFSVVREDGLEVELLYLTHEVKALEEGRLIRMVRVYNGPLAGESTNFYGGIWMIEEEYEIEKNKQHGHRC